MTYSLVSVDDAVVFCVKREREMSACDAWTDVREVFDLFDFWDGRDGLVDGFKLGDFLRCCGLNPTQTLVMENGGTKKLGTAHHSLRLRLSSNFHWNIG